MYLMEGHGEVSDWFVCLAGVDKGNILWKVKLRRFVISIVYKAVINIAAGSKRIFVSLGVPQYETLLTNQAHQN